MLGRKLGLICITIIFSGALGAFVDHAHIHADCNPAQISADNQSNLITNSGFETNTDGWMTIASPTLAASAVQYQSGCRSLLTSGRVNTYDAPALDLLSILTNGKIYRISAWARSDTLSTMTLVPTLKLTDGSGTNYTFVDEQIINNSGWTKLIGYLNYSVSGTATESILYFQQPWGDTVEPNLYLDEVVIEEVPLLQSYYINPATGSDDNIGRGESNAWQTTAHISTYPFRAGDRIYFARNHSYLSNNPLTFGFSGTSGNPVVLGAYGSGTDPEFENNDAGNVNETIMLISGDYYQVSGLKFTNSNLANIRASAVELTGQNITLDDLEIDSTGYGVKTTGGHNLVKNSYVHDLVMIQNTNNDGNDDYGAIGVLIEGADNITVESNRFLNVYGESYDYGLDGTIVECYHSCDNVTVRYNTAINGESLLEIGSDNHSDVAQNFYVHHNVVVNFRAPIGALHNDPLSSSNFGMNISDIYIDNNTFYKNSALDTGFVMALEKDPVVNEFFLRNNIFAIANIANWIWYPTNVVHLNNIYTLSNIADFDLVLHSSEVHGLNSFVDILAGNARLVAGSGAIDAGLDLSYTRDIYGTIGSKGSAFDIGAAEFIPSEVVQDSDEEDQVVTQSTNTTTDAEERQTIYTESYPVNKESQPLSYPINQSDQSNQPNKVAKIIEEPRGQNSWWIAIICIVSGIALYLLFFRRR